MTSADPTALTLVQTALSEVFTSETVAILRPDSPLTAVGCTDADVVCVVDAIALAARQQGASCVLEDQDMAGVVTVFDLVAAVQGKLEGQGPA